MYAETVRLANEFAVKEKLSQSCEEVDKLI